MARSFRIWNVADKPGLIVVLWKKEPEQMNMSETRKHGMKLMLTERVEDEVLAKGELDSIHSETEVKETVGEGFQNPS